jgi:putative ABC transport system permease protein
MFRHIFKIAIRSYIKNKSFAFINIFGLSFGLATFILIALYVQYEFSFDKFHNKYERIYSLQPIAHMADGDKYWQQLGYPVSNALTEIYPEIEQSVVVRPVWGEYLSSSERLTFYEENGMYAEQSFFNIFTAEFLEGTAVNALNEPYNIILTESLKEKYFPDEKALGKFIRSNNRYEL